MTMVRPSEFGALMDEASDEIQEQALQFRNLVGMNLLTGVVMKTPVATGRARANWQVTFGEAAQNSLDTRDLQGTATIEREQGDLEGAPLDGITWLTNNVTYIERLEEGHSMKQAPNGMVAITMQELETAFR